MKTSLSLVLIALISFSFLSCSKDSAKDDSNKKDLKQKLSSKTVWSISVGATPPTINPLSSTTVDATKIQNFSLGRSIGCGSGHIGLASGLGQKLGG